MEVRLFVHLLPVSEKLMKRIKETTVNLHRPCQPESEMSPDSKTNLFTDLSPDADALHAKCLHFDIHSNAEDSAESDCIVERCKDITIDIEDKLRAAVASCKHAQIKELILTHYDDLFKECPSMPRTQEQREVIRRNYQNHDRHWLWAFVTREYHDSTGDPTSKSDAFLEVMYVIISTVKRMEGSREAIK